MLGSWGGMCVGSPQLESIPLQGRRDGGGYVANLIPPQSGNQDSKVYVAFLNPAAMEPGMAARPKPFDALALESRVMKMATAGSTPPPCVQRIIMSLNNKVRTGVFVGHAVRCARQYCETAVTHP